MQWLQGMRYNKSWKGLRKREGAFALNQTKMWASAHAADDGSQTWGAINCIEVNVVSWRYAGTLQEGGKAVGRESMPHTSLLISSTTNCGIYYFFSAACLCLQGTSSSTPAISQALRRI